MLQKGARWNFNNMDIMMMEVLIDNSTTHEDRILLLSPKVKVQDH